MSVLVSVSLCVCERVSVIATQADTSLPHTLKLPNHPESVCGAATESLRPSRPPKFGCYLQCNLGILGTPRYRVTDLFCGLTQISAKINRNKHKNTTHVKTGNDKAKEWVGDDLRLQRSFT